MTGSVERCELIFVGDPCCDHSPSSGYHQLCSLFPDAGWLAGRPLERGNETWYRRPAATDEPAVQLVHVLYGDCSGKTLFEPIRARFPEAFIVSSVHQPVALLRRDPLAHASLSKADAIVAVSRTQVVDLAALGVERPLFAVPHGVWAQAFRPPALEACERRDVLLVGNYLRDWESGGRVARLLAGLGVRCVVVGSNAPADPFGGAPPVEVRMRVSERDLAGAYDRAAALLMPLRDATASNALLEAMAAGCPVVCTRCRSLVDDYLGDDDDAFPESGEAVAVERLMRYVRDADARARRSRSLMRRAELFDWARLKSFYCDVYREIVDAVRPARQAPAAIS